METTSATRTLAIAERQITEEIRRCKNLHYRFKRRLNKLSLPSGLERLICTTKGGRNYYSEFWHEGGVRKTRYLGTADDPEVLEIQEKHFLIKAIALLEKRIAELEDCARAYEPLTPEAINLALPKVYQLPQKRLREIFGPDAGEKWYADALKEKAAIEAEFGEWYPEGLKHRAKDGTKMRSKSEVAVANELISRGIPYIYEMPVFAGPMLMHPDFTFYSYSRGKAMLWEHAGMLGDDNYMNDFSERVDTYIKQGLYPCVDILFTFDTKEGRIDTRSIDAVIDEYR